MFGNIQINNRTREILDIINSDRLNSLDYATINFYKRKLLNEMDRLNCIMPVVPQCAQEEINDKLITQLEGAMDKLNSVENPEQSSLKTLVRRLDFIRSR